MSPSQTWAFAGIDPLTGRKHYLRETVGPRREAERARTRLLSQVDENRNPRTRGTVNRLLAPPTCLTHGDHALTRAFGNGNHRARDLFHLGHLTDEPDATAERTTSPGDHHPTRGPRGHARALASRGIPPLGSRAMTHGGRRNTRVVAAVCAGMAQAYMLGLLGVPAALTPRRRRPLSRPG